MGMRSERVLNWSGTHNARDLGAAATCGPSAGVRAEHAAKVAAVIKIADAGPGRALVHCGGSRDQTELITLGLLAAMGLDA
jgi:hypothetical protein